MNDQEKEDGNNNNILILSWNISGHPAVKTFLDWFDLVPYRIQKRHDAVLCNIIICVGLEEKINSDNII